MIVTRDEIVSVANMIAFNDQRALCPAFASANGPHKYNVKRYLDVPKYLNSLGGKGRGHPAWYWNGDTEQGRDQRLMFLAFMLTWHDDITGEGK
jgi:hypothetical protein